MNDAHLHLLVNHFPITGTIFGFLVLLGGLYFKSTSIKNTAYLLFIIATTFTVFSMVTGEGAEKMVEDLPEIGHKIIHNHEETAEKFAVLMYLLGCASVIGLISNITHHSKALFFAYSILVIAIVAVIVSVKVGTTGGEIRHTEIRNDMISTKINTEASSTIFDKD